MLYDTTDIFKARKSDVLKYVDEYTIMCDVLGYKPSIGKLYSSPTRRDTNPSFGIFYARNGNLLFKDLGTGESGNCFKLVSIVESIPISDVYEHLHRIYSNGKLPTKVKKVKPPVIPKGKIEIVVEKMDFTESALEYWKQFHISLKTLQHFKVFQALKVWANGRLLGFHTEKNPIFDYQVFDKDKIYRPFHKTKKFYTNCDTFDIQGWEQVDYSRDTIFITKSLKDVMALYELGHTAIAPNGEGHSIPAKALKILRDNFKYIIVLYDKDGAGMLGARKLIRNNPDFGFIFTPSKKVKDVSDFIKRDGFDTVKKFISKRLDYVKKAHFRGK